ncbi:RidA family protein [Chelativorans sp. Marseille-P2723]|uniref:RidA family protein n=1 Tax=Chelativorans sp. Marseille-P2723 TaxID=2709133 RepID=UPI00156ED217|nr:RidA family protein [Chelativorans sp. Marseille-P2723]
MKRIDSNSRRSRAVVTNGICHLGGQVADDVNGDIRVQTQQALAKIDDLLAQAGTDKSKLVSVTIWLKSMDDYAGMNEVWDRWIDPQNPPARACGEVRMADDRFRVEIIATAAV